MDKFKIFRRALLASLVILAFYILICPLVLASSGQAVSLPVMFNGIGNRLVDLGFDSIVGVTQANIYYNIISFSLVFSVAAYADYQSSAMFSLLATMMAAVCAWFGWFTCANAIGPWGIVTMCGLISVMMYMSDANKLGIPSSGGDKLISIVLFLMLIQSSVAMIQGVNVMGTNIGSTALPSYCSASGGNYTNCQLNGGVQLSNIGSNTGSNGINSNGFDWLSTAVTMGWNVLAIVVQIVISVAAFSIVLIGAFPFLNNGGGIAIIAIMQVAIWVIYALAISRYVWKVMPGDLKVS